MTISEIESTLKTLETRHPKLDEAMLVTLLRAGGWEEKVIQEAIMVFRGGGKKSTPEVKMFQVTETSHVLPEIVHTDHLLVSHTDGSTAMVNLEKTHTEAHIENTVTEIVEPQSLIEPVVTVVPPQEAELPDNLPLRPFESTSQVWPFSRYKDVFHGEVMPGSASEDSKWTPEPVRVFARQEAQAKVIEKHIVVDHVRISRTPLSSKDEKLIVLTCTMLLMIVLLLVYMYSNGRL